MIPEKLTPVGTIPLTSTTALAARTARERKPEVVNNFSTARHANVFEAVPLGRDPNELIQKIMSAPILDGTRVHGVVQISRKATISRPGGRRFHAERFAHAGVAFARAGPLSETLPRLNEKSHLSLIQEVPSFENHSANSEIQDGVSLNFALSLTSGFCSGRLPRRTGIRSVPECQPEGWRYNSSTKFVAFPAYFEFSSPKAWFRRHPK